MYKRTVINTTFGQITAFGIGLRLACGMFTGALRSRHTAWALILMSTVFFLYYVDEIARTLCGGGSCIAWAGTTTLKAWLKPFGYSTLVDTWFVQRMLHIPEYFLIHSIFALISLIMVHSVKNSLEGQSCGVGRSFFRARVAWRFILAYAMCMSIISMTIGDIYHLFARMFLRALAAMPFCVNRMHDHIYGKQVLSLVGDERYWLPYYIRIVIAGVWYYGTFLMFPVVVNERISFWRSMGRSFSLAFQNFGLLVSAVCVYICAGSGIIAMTIYVQAATFPSLEGAGIKGAHVIALFALMALIMLTVHSGIVASGSLITAQLLYRLSTGTRLPSFHVFWVKRPYVSFLLYLLLYCFYWIIIRCGIHVQMPSI